MMKIALAQINPTVGDLAGNSRRLLAACREAAAASADLVVAPELSLTGYPPLDLLQEDAFIQDVQLAIRALEEVLPDGIGLLVGAPIPNPLAHSGAEGHEAQHTAAEGHESTSNATTPNSPTPARPYGKPLLNAAILLEKGCSPQVVHKRLLPTYDVFDECRYFEPAGPQPLMTFRGAKLGVSICEDMWNEPFAASYHLYAAHPIDDLAALGPDVLINISASPYSCHSPGARTALGEAICRRHGLPLVLVNQVGANTDLIFDGDSRVHAPGGTIDVLAPSFEEALLYWEFDPASLFAQRRTSSPPSTVSTPTTPTGAAETRACPTPPCPAAHEPADRLARMHQALVLGIRDYVRKSGVFDGALIGLSGGIDSAVTAALAAEALGADHVLGVTMPSRFSSTGSVTDSEALAHALGITLHKITIEPAVSAFENMLAPHFAGSERGLAEENIQARVRGTALMALSNKFNRILLATGNKSELAMGYATLYGDMAGGLAVLADVYKVDVYALAGHMNARAGRDLIPRATIEKPPSAELRPGQKDEDSLPPYDVLDAVLTRYIDRRENAPAIERATGFDGELIRSILRAVDLSEYKRKQAAPGLRVSAKAFGAGRRYPITARRTSSTGLTAPLGHSDNPNTAS